MRMTHTVGLLTKWQISQGKLNKWRRISDNRLRRTFPVLLVQLLTRPVMSVNPPPPPFDDANLLNMASKEAHAQYEAMKEGSRRSVLWMWGKRVLTPARSQLEWRRPLIHLGHQYFG